MADQPDFYTSDEVARIARLAPWTVRRMIREGVFPNVVKPSKRWLIPAEDLASYLQQEHGRRTE